MEKTQFQPREPISTEPRDVTRWGPEGERVVVKGVMPSPFSADRANAIWEEARRRTTYGPVSDQMTRVMTDNEIAYVLAVWEAVPSGASSFMSTFETIRRGQFPGAP